MLRMNLNVRDPVLIGDHCGVRCHSRSPRESEVGTLGEGDSIGLSRCNIGSKSERVGESKQSKNEREEVGEHSCWQDEVVVVVTGTDEFNETEKTVEFETKRKGRWRNLVEEKKKEHAGIDRRISA